MHATLPHQLIKTYLIKWSFCTLGCIEYKSLDLQYHYLCHHGLLQNICFVRLCYKMFHRRVRILMRTNCATLIVHLFFFFVYCYASQWMAKLQKNPSKNPLMSLFNNKCGYLDFIFLRRSEFVQVVLLSFVNICIAVTYRFKIAPPCGLCSPESNYTLV